MAVVAAGCADEAEPDGVADEGGLSTEEQEYADAFAATLEDDAGGFGVTSEQASCMAEALVAEVGAEPFVEADVRPDDIEPGPGSSSPGALLGDDVVSREQADAVLDVWADDCVDLVEMLVASAGSDLELDDEGRE